jgi:hypothetical protein
MSPEHQWQDRVGDELRQALQLMAVAEPVDLPALASQVRTRTGARKRRRAIVGSAVAVVVCVCLAVAAVAAVPRLAGREGTTSVAAAPCPQPIPPEYRRVDTGLGGMTGVVPPGWTGDMVPAQGSVVRGSIQTTSHSIDGNFVIYRYDAAPGVATLTEFEDSASTEDGHQLAGFRLLRSAPVTYGTAQQAWDSEYEFGGFPTTRAYRRDWWIDGRIYSIFFIAPERNWTELSPTRQIVLEASRPC